MQKYFSFHHDFILGLPEKGFCPIGGQYVPIYMFIENENISTWYYMIWLERKCLFSAIIKTIFNIIHSLSPIQWRYHCTMGKFGGWHNHRVKKHFHIFWKVNRRRINSWNGEYLLIYLSYRNIKVLKIEVQSTRSSFLPSL